MRNYLLGAVALSVAAAVPASAHPRLLSSTPAANSVVRAPAQINLAFSETLVVQFSGGELAMIEMPGMKMALPMKMTIKTSLTSDGKSLVFAPAKPLPRGTYKLDWHAVSTDTHRVQGSLVFKVK